MAPTPVEAVYLSGRPPLDTPTGIVAVLRNPWAWIVTALLGVLRAGSATRSSGIDPLVVAAAAVVFITVPGVLWSLPTAQNARLGSRPLSLAGGRLFMMYPRTFHAGEANRPAKRVGRTARQPRRWIESGVALEALKVEQAWVGYGHPLARAGQGELDGPDAESRLHQVDLVAGKARVSLCKCIDPAMELMPIVRGAGLKAAAPAGGPRGRVRVTAPPP